jgi:two-component system cell cycle sensor histidine kinase/response regulator CckA
VTTRDFVDEFGSNYKDLYELSVALFDAIPDIIGVQKLDHTIVRYNKAGYDYFHKSPEEVNGLKCYEVIGHTHPCEVCATAKTLRSKKPERIEKYVPEMDIWFDVRTYPVFNDKKELYLVIEHLRDITDIKKSEMAIRKAEEEKRKLTEQLLQLQKMEALGRMSGGIAHDINNILVPIIGYSEIILDEFNPSDKIYADLKSILESAQKASQLTKQILAFSRKQVLNISSLNLNDIITNFLQLIKKIIGETITIEKVLDPDLYMMEGDKNQIEQVLMNLIVNAKDAMPNGGKITIETCNAFLDDSYVKKLTEPIEPGLYLRLSISDTGCGMDKEILDKIFEPFFTTKEHGKGTGLGMPMVLGIVKQHHGHINIYSEVGKGTTIKIYFPKSEKSNVEIHEIPQKVEEIRGSEHIVILEDDEMVRKFLEDALSRFGYRVKSYPEPEFLLREYKETPFQIDLLISDVIMPKMDGPTLYSEIKQHIPNLRVMFISGYTQNVDIISQIINKGAVFLAKPFSIPDLAQKVKLALKGNGPPYF